ncbi:MAG: protein kinase domain-containing protein [Polyangiales bacterium]
MSNGATLPAKANANIDSAKDADVLPRLLGRYVLLRLMVRGGMGEVYLATTIGIEGAERPCVVKRIRREYKSDPSFHARFLDEARVQAQLDDPGVARIVEATVDEHGDPYVVVEYVEGRSMADVRSRLNRMGKPLPWADAVAVTLEIASALAHVHERTGPDGAPLGIVHRDLSPQNVMVGFSGDVKLIDFGTARGDNRRCHTVSGTVLAKPGYVAPEVARGDSATPRADIYALGVMFWELVSGRRFIEGDPTEHVANVTAGRLRPAKLSSDANLAQLGDGPVPAELDRIIAWLTEPVASQRCGKAREAAQALAGLLSSAPRRPVEERGVRARVKAMLARLYPTEPAASRVEFARLVSKARRVLASELADLSPTGPMVKKADITPEPQTQIPDGLPGTRYRLIRRLGEGAMGVVYEAEHVDLGRKVAVKVLQGKHSASPDFVARFRREARAIAGLAHPNLVHVYDFGQTMGDSSTSEWGGRLFFVMERLEGETLDEFLDRERGIDWRDGCELAIKTCRALEAAHAAGLVHRDLKPANLFLTYAGRRPASLAEVGVKLLDFGVAKEMRGVTSASEAAGQDDPNLSKAGMIFGTPETMSPEQVAGEEVDHRADVYALGCVIYQMLSGQPVFDAPSPVLMMSCHLREAPKPLRAAAPTRGVPEAIERVVMRALAKDPKDRYADAGEMREALEEACYGGFFMDSQLPSAAIAKEDSFEIVVDTAPAKIEETSRIDRPRRRAPGILAFATLAACAIMTMAAHRAHKIPDMRGFVPQNPFAHKTMAAHATLPASPIVEAPVTGGVEKAPEKHEIAPSKPAIAPVVHVNAPVIEAPVQAKPKAIAEIEAKISRGEAEEALVLARSTKEDGTAASAEAWAHAAFAAGKLSEAHDACVAWIARHSDPKALEPRLADARALRELGRLPEAKARLEEAAKLHPESSEVQQMLKDHELLDSAKPSPARHLKKKKGAQKLLG